MCQNCGDPQNIVILSLVPFEPPPSTGGAEPQKRTSGAEGFRVLQPLSGVLSHLDRVPPGGTCQPLYTPRPERDAGLKTPPENWTCWFSSKEVRITTGGPSRAGKRKKISRTHHHTARKGSMGLEVPTPASQAKSNKAPGASIAQKPQLLEAGPKASS